MDTAEQLKLSFELKEKLSITCSCYFQSSAVLANQGGASWLEVSKWDTHLQEGLEGGYAPISLTSVLGKVIEQITFSAVTWHVQDNQVISHKSANLISF